MKKPFVIGLLAAAVGLSAQADGFYVGGEIQQTKSYDKDFCEDSSSCDIEPTGYRLNAGYGFNDFLALELGYMDSGEFESKISETNYQQDVSLTSEAIDLSLIGRLPISDSFSLFGRVGAARVMNDSKISGSGFSTAFDNSVTTYVYGVGAQLSWLVVGYDVITDNELKINGTTLSEKDIKRIYAGVKLGF